MIAKLFKTPRKIYFGISLEIIDEYCTSIEASETCFFVKLSVFISLRNIYKDKMTRLVMFCLFTYDLSYVLITITRSSRLRRQQNKTTGLMDEFINTTVVAKLHSFFQTSLRDIPRVNKIYTGKYHIIKNM